MAYFSAFPLLWLVLLGWLISGCGLQTEAPQPEIVCFPACSVDQTCTLSEDRRSARCVDTFTGGGPLTGKESCQWLAECVDACEHAQLGSDCARECELQAEEDVLKAHSTWRACVQTNCNAIRSPECLHEWCAPQTTRCFGELPGEALTIGPMSCFEVGECAQACQDDDPECAEQCRRRGTKSAQGNWDALMTCAQQSCSDILEEPVEVEFSLPGESGHTAFNAYLACAEQDCPQPWATCFGPGPDPAEGTASCTEIHLCMQECSDSICKQNCMASGTLDARRHYQNFLQCTLSNCNSLQKKEIDGAMCNPVMCGELMDVCFNGEHFE